MKRKAHVCREAKDCCCSLQALEPDEDCPVHAQGPWPPRCEVCGRFMRRTPAYDTEYPGEFRQEHDEVMRAIGQPVEGDGQEYGEIMREIGQ